MVETRSRSATASPARRGPSARGGAFAEAAAASAAADGGAADEAAFGELVAKASGPMLMPEPSPLDDVPDVPFAQLCHDGTAVTARNWLVKLWRYTVVPTKQLYLPWMFSGLPTNYLMLTYRTFNRDFGLPNCNDDDLAPLLRDELMPDRGRMHRERDLGLWYRTRGLDMTYLGVPGLVNFIDARTRWIDDGMKRALDDGIKQVVIIAAGYDTRAYRLGRPGVKFYEVDLPHASEKKRELVEKLFPADKYPRPQFIGADLSQVGLADALAPSDFDRSRRTLYLIEGLVYYLPPVAFKSLLSALAETAAVGSRLYFDFINLSTMSGDVFHPGFETLMVSVWNKGEYFLSGLDEREQCVRAVLKKFGFRLHELVDAKALAARYLSHLEWKDKAPPLPPYFGYIAGEKALPPLKRIDSVEAPPRRRK
ncbi:S-adenosyl-L-methionine-dependent methyltransferase [Raphidocelis subcapitata]|uniref:S-adenosyl-L-methionine-dependent methyltransferase n=1 Tax=Raphidocelis subcapitata TaxID=307507 RepID=A0A2V0PF45_9CHLO|nr:S-adenosyl-L-methionine-dependent methyltransferase [Raphidocelis subcapitata]|eukprot:GBF98456.1 S-adenosyl-L-methionine-dependent methyltransferase [Raphidocelis subcapitata]